MSLILEALRKSEAERRRGQVPGLHAGPAPGLVPLRDRPPAWLWPALAVGALVLAIALWMLGRPSPPPAPASAASVAATRSAGVGDSQRDASPPEEPVAGVESGFGGPETGASAARVPPYTRQPRDARAPVDPSLGPAPAYASGAEATNVVVAPAAPAAALTGVEQGPRKAATPPIAAPATVPAAAPSGATASPAAPASSPLRLSDLSVAQRQQLPPLKISMHMWAPTQKFAIIDGTRVAKGDRVGAAVVEEITATGVVLDWQGQRLQIPVR